MELKDFIVDFANEFDDTDSSVFNAKTEYQNLEEWSSLVILGVMAFVRTKYGIKITASDLRSCNTIEELFNLIQQR